MDLGIFENALSSLTDAIIIFGAGGEALWANPAAEQLIGASLQRLEGKRAGEIFRDSPVIAGEMERVAREACAIFDNEIRFKNLVGAEFPISVSIHPMEESRGQVVVLRDLTGLKALERAIGLKEKAEETAILAAGIAHEIKNPLAGIRGAAQLLERETRGQATCEYASLIIGQADRINRLIVDLIDLNNPAMFIATPVNVHAALDEAILAQRPDMEKRGISLRRQYDPSLPPVEGNKDRLVQIFLNLVKNAVEASPEGRAITIQSGPAWRLPDGAPPRKDKKYAAIEIIDEGQGIGGGDIRSLFTPFFTRKKGGAGLGLTVTLNLVRAHNGLLTVNNRKEGRGVEAVVYLPFA